MKKAFRLIVALLLFGGWALAASAVHVVVAPGQVVVIPKDHLTMKETIVDARKWTANDAAAHTSVVSRLTATNHADALSHLSKGNR